MANRRGWIIGLLVVIAVIGIVIDLVGLAAVWLLNRPLTDFGVGLLQAGQATAAAVEKVIPPLEAALDEIQEPVNAVASAAEELSQSTAEPGLLLRLLPEALSDQLTSALTGIQEIFSGLEETILALNQTLEALNALPLVSVPTLSDTDLPERYDNLQSQIQSMRETAAEARSGISGRFEALADQSAATSETIQGWRQVLAEIAARLEGIQIRLKDLASGLPLWIDLAAVAASLLLLAGMASQAAVLLLARSLYKNTRLQLQPGWTLGEEAAV